MTTANQWFGKIKSRAKSVQETAKSQLEKFTETIDKKLKEAQDDLEKQRSKIEASDHENQQVKIWQPSIDNPDGKIIPLAKPPSPTVTRNILTLDLHSQLSKPVEELPTIAHTKAKRSHANQQSSLSTSRSLSNHGNDSGTEDLNHIRKKRDIHKQCLNSLNNIIDDIVNGEVIEQCLNELIDIIFTVDELVENTASISVAEPQNFEIDQETTNSEFENDFNQKQECCTSLKTESDQEIIKKNISHDVLPLIEDTENASIVYTDLESIPLDTIDHDLSISINSNELFNNACDSKDNNLTTSDNEIETISSELEDSFNEFAMSPARVSSQNKQPSEPSAAFTELKKWILKIEQDVDLDTDVLPFESDIHVTNDIDNNFTKQSDIPDVERENSPSISNSNSNEVQEEIQNESMDPIDSIKNEVLFSEVNQNTYITLSQSEAIQVKPFSIVNYYAIPTRTQIRHITCSATYIYICTNEYKIYYAKLESEDMTVPFKWIQHSDLAEQLAVNISNRTVWRLFNKHLYSSMDPMRFPPIGSYWNEIKIDKRRSLLSMSLNDQCGWFVKDDGTLWLIRLTDEKYQAINVMCPFNLNRLCCCSEKVAVATSDGEILIRMGCTADCPEGDGWIFIDHKFGPLNDFILLENNNIILMVDEKHHLWIHQWTSNKGFLEVLYDDDSITFYERCLLCVNAKSLFITDCEEQIHSFSKSLTGIQWQSVENNTRLQRLIGAFTNENFVWALTTDKMIRSSNSPALEKPEQAQFLTHASFVPDHTSEGTILWALDESCNIYVRANTNHNTEWEQLDQSQFGWNLRLVHIVCNNVGVWAVDDQGSIHFRHGHISACSHIHSNESSLLPPAWISIPGQAKRYRAFSQIYCGPEDWMVYATDNKQTVYARIGINEDNRVGTSWEPYEDCSALELAISDRALWLLNSFGQIQCRENISLTNPIGTRSTTLSGLFLSLAVSIDDSQVWALDSKRSLLKLDRLTVLFKK